MTTFALSFYQDVFTNQAIQPLHHLLEIEGANGCQVPYLGYTETSITFPKEFVGSDIDVQTLALIIPDSRPNAQLLIGTNTLNSLYSEYTSSKSLNNQPILQGYQAVMQVLEFVHRQDVEVNLAWVSLNCRVPQTIPAEKTVVLEESI